MALSYPRTSRHILTAKLMTILICWMLNLGAAPAAAQTPEPERPPGEAEDSARTSKKKNGFVGSLNELFAPKELLGDLGRIGTHGERRKFYLLGIGIGLTAIALEEGDEGAFVVLNDNRLGRLNNAMNFIGSGQVLYPALIGTFFAGKALDKPGVSNTAAQMTQALILTDLLVGTTKITVRRLRPDQSNRRSFPSGHTAGAFALATVVQRNYGSRAGIPAYALATLIGAARIDKRKHYLSDTITGATIGIIVAHTVADRFKRRGISVHPVRNITGGAGLGLTIEF